MVTLDKQQAVTCGCRSLQLQIRVKQYRSGTCKCTTNLLICDERLTSYPVQLLSSDITTDCQVCGFTTTLISCCSELALQACHTIVSGFWILADITDSQEGLGTVDLR